LEPESELVIYRVAQEALTNVARHANTDSARLELGTEDCGRLVLTVSDDGNGLSDDGEPGSGIRGMRERAALIGAELTVAAGAGGRGCVVRLVLATRQT
jgi:two-component system sensor histidine kinase UhpB